MSATRLLRQQWLATKFTQPLKRWNSTAAGLQVMLIELHSGRLGDSLIPHSMNTGKRSQDQQGRYLEAFGA